MEAISSYPYPIAEHCIEPRNQHEQADEELRLYRTSEEMRARLDMLRLMYAKTPIMQSMCEFSEFAAAVRSPSSEVGSDDFNSDFYDGMQMAVHINLAPASDKLQHYVRGVYFMPNVGGDDDSEAIKMLQEWADTKWQDFYDAQDEDFQSRAMALGERLYEDDDDCLERQYDYILGYTYASNLVWSAAATYQSRTLA